jgi:serine/threonine protein kinase
MQDDPGLPQLSTAGLKWLGVGISGIVFPIDNSTVVKIAPKYDNEYASNTGLQDLITERTIYERLGDHPRICRYISSVQRGIILERLGDSLRKHLLSLHKRGETLPFDLAMKWTCQTAEAVAYIHRKGVVHRDIGCHNILLNDEDVKLCDFGGSSIDGKPAQVGYECRSQRWDKNMENPSIKSELFALGSTFYEV